MARCNKYFPCNFIKELGGCIPHPNRCEDKRWEVFFSITASFLVTLKGCVTSCLGYGYLWNSGSCRTLFLDFDGLGPVSTELWFLSLFNLFPLHCSGVTMVASNFLSF